ncbi:branched-chain amino acid aminotransferase [Streptomyces radicis]|uniref:Branched-chain-amino-acid aminotransferase n=1 Tax=Streptomyces radicis TaxID=1750517 RepID=A0A3A9WIY8_9ACTN|nr:branched-chain amino acid aminotransferase [Streptomyces radicis]RKN09424.1 branched-chain amino acid aminotransferase [Streptomyces radicis]RKN23178.1 branched-chain amino acid aminotransferase [Streptomyces radicis]
MTTTTPLTFDLKPAAEPLSDQEREAALADPGFGRYFTDHMVTIRWTEGRGWHDARLQPYAPIPMDPATMALHYGQEIFEGLKAYRQPDGSVAVFRPEANARRFQLSARRLAMPELPVDAFVEAIDLLVRQDVAWVPTRGEQSLYLRPFMFATEVGLGINRPANEYLFMVIASPAGAYFPRGIKPVSVWLSREYVRAAPGGTGEAKCAGNYAAAFLAQAEATRNGCDQVVWLDATERRWVEEMGGMNLYFVHGEGDAARITTPELTGTLLPGITRDSLLTIARDLGHPVDEVRISTDEWRRGNEDGAISEVFACGTAAVITPVGSVKSSDAAWLVADGQPGSVTMRLREELLGIQTGRVEDRHGWMHHIV